MNFFKLDELKFDTNEYGKEPILFNLIILFNANFSDIISFHDTFYAGMNCFMGKTNHPLFISFIHFFIVCPELNK